MHKSRIHSLCSSAAIYLCLACFPVYAQLRPENKRTLDERLAGFSFNIPSEKERGFQPGSRGGDSQEMDPLVNPFTNNILAILEYALPDDALNGNHKQFLRLFEATRVDKQIGASSSAGAATSAAARAGLNSLIGIALEAGALTQTIDQNVITFRANADGLFRFISNQEVLPLCSSSDLKCQPSWAKNVEVSASFYASTGGTPTLSGQSDSGMPVDFTAVLNKRQFSSASLRYAILNPRDLRSPVTRRKWRTWFDANKPTLANSGKDLVKAGLDAFSAFMNSQEFRNWQNETATVLKDAGRDPQERKMKFAARLDAALAMARGMDPQFDEKLIKLAEAYMRFFSTRTDLGDNLPTGTQLLIEGTYSTPTLQPRVFNAKASFAMSPKGVANTGNNGTVTANFGVTFYIDPQPTGSGTNSNRFRDIQAALQFDRPIGTVDSPAQFSLGLYYQYQKDPAIFSIPGGSTLPGTSIPVTADGSTVLSNVKGSLYVVATGVTLRLGSSGVKVPIGVSWANRSELLKGNEIRGHVGFTFDTDSLLTLFK